MDQVKGWESALIFLPGAGTSLLVDRLLEAGAKLVLNDLSSSAFEQLTERLGERAESAEWLCQDIAHPLSSAISSVDELSERLGEGFELIDQFGHTYINPAGEPGLISIRCSNALPSVCSTLSQQAG